MQLPRVPCREQRRRNLPNKYGQLYSAYPSRCHVDHNSANVMSGELEALTEKPGSGLGMSDQEEPWSSTSQVRRLASESTKPVSQTLLT